MNLTTCEYKKDISMEEALDIDMKIFKAIKAYKLQSLGKLAVNVVVDRLNLEPFYEFVLLFNQGNDLPYHNYYHLTCVLLNSYEGGWHAALSDDELRGLCAGALLHDFGHSGGKCTDDVNIKIALAGLRTAQVYAKSKLMELSPAALAVAESVIKVTQYPFIHNPVTLPEQIIRDADLMQPYEVSDDAVLKQYLGLKKEIEIQRAKIYTNNEFADGVKAFQANETIWYTEWARNKAHDREWEYQILRLVRLLTSGGVVNANS